MKDLLEVPCPFSKSSQNRCMFGCKLLVGNLLLVKGLDWGGYLLPKQKLPVFLHELNPLLWLVPNTFHFLRNLFIPWLRNLLFDILVWQNIIKFLANNPLNLLLLLPLQFVFLISLGDHHLIGSVLSQPKKMLIELSKFLIDSPLPSVSYILLSNLNSSIDNLHYKFCIISILLQCHYFFIIFISFHIQIVPDLNTTRKDKIVLFVVSPVNVCDHLSHPGGASWGGSLGVPVRQIL